VSEYPKKKASERRTDHHAQHLTDGTPGEAVQGGLNGHGPGGRGKVSVVVCVCFAVLCVRLVRHGAPCAE